MTSVTVFKIYLKNSETYKNVRFQIECFQLKCQYLTNTVSF